MTYEVVVTGKGGTPAKNKTQAKKLVGELARAYEADGWTKAFGSAQNGAFKFVKDGEAHGIIVRPWL